MFTLLLRRVLALLGCGLLCLLAACGAPSLVQSTNTTATVSAKHSDATSTQNVITRPMPPTETSCPPPGTTRGWVSAPLATGKEPTIVYAINEYTSQSSTHIPVSGTLKRYDVKTGHQVEIVKLAHASISTAQLSADGQWILFESQSSDSQYQLQLVRMDGQGLQTLFCSSNDLQSIQWSTNEQWIVFSGFGNNGNDETITLLGAQTGKLQVVFHWPMNSQSRNRGYIIHTWLDNYRIYLTGINIDQPASEVFLLDTTKGPQEEKDLLPVVTENRQNPAWIGDLDSSYDGMHLFLDHGHCGQGGCLAPSDITVLPATGGTQHTIFRSDTYDAISVRAVTSHTLLMVVYNSAPPLVRGSIDTSGNGLWSMNVDGSSLTRLMKDDTYTHTFVNQYSQYPWSNVSRDGTMYAVTSVTYQSRPVTYHLSFGSLTGGPATTFASASNGTELWSVGWTTF